MRDALTLNVDNDGGLGDAVVVVVVGPTVVVVVVGFPLGSAFAFVAVDAEKIKAAVPVTNARRDSSMVPAAAAQLLLLAVSTRSLDLLRSRMCVTN